MKNMQSKVAIVTGASSGIGKSTAELLAQRGASVIISDIDERLGNEVADNINTNGGKAVFVKADVSLPADNEALVNRVLKEFGRLDIAINNAGIGGPLGPTGEYPIEGWQKVIDINLSGVFYGMRYQIPAMLENGGSIVNVGSILGNAGTSFSPAYVAAKHGVIGLTKAAALEYASKGIRINSVGPGYIDTPLLSVLDDATKEHLVGLHPIGRLGTAEEVAQLIVWLASDEASFVIGSYHPVDGGYLAQ